jgi:hypothetical protein
MLLLLMLLLQPSPSHLLLPALPPVVGVTVRGMGQAARMRMVGIVLKEPRRGMVATAHSNSRVLGMGLQVVLLLQQEAMVGLRHSSHRSSMRGMGALRLDMALVGAMGHKQVDTARVQGTRVMVSRLWLLLLVRLLLLGELVQVQEEGIARGLQGPMGSSKVLQLLLHLQVVQVMGSRLRLMGLRRVPLVAMGLRPLQPRGMVLRAALRLRPLGVMGAMGHSLLLLLGLHRVQAMGLRLLVGMGLRLGMGRKGQLVRTQGQLRERQGLLVHMGVQQLEGMVPRQLAMVLR